MRLSEAAVALLEIKKAFNVMIIKSFLGFMRMSFLVLSKNCDSSVNVNWLISNRNQSERLDFTLICKIYQ